MVINEIQKNKKKYKYKSQTNKPKVTSWHLPIGMLKWLPPTPKPKENLILAIYSILRLSFYPCEACSGDGKFQGDKLSFIICSL